MEVKVSSVMAPAPKELGEILPRQSPSVISEPLEQKPRLLQLEVPQRNGGGGAPRTSVHSMASAPRGRISVHSMASARSRISDASIMQKVMTRFSTTQAWEFETEESTEQPFIKREPGCAISLKAVMVFAFSSIVLLSVGSLWLAIEVIMTMDIDVQSVRLTFAIVLCVSLVLSVVFAVILSAAILKPLKFLGALAAQVSNPNCSDSEPPESRASCLWIQDVGNSLEDIFSSLFRAVGMFMRYLPDTVVRQILRGEQEAMRLHVSKRTVTIMFSDIKDFTTIAEQLKQEDLLFLLTRYLSVMTKIIESYNGVLAEIMGDGMLVFWNTPDDVDHHEAEACASALAMQQALTVLNKELSELGFPTIAVRIGIHTGRVLTGNIGSETKMKFGCIGDPMNLSARLEGLCKFYGVNIICSKRTFDALPADASFLCRELDLVQVKGKHESVSIYEVIESSNADEFLGHGTQVWRRALTDSAKSLMQSQSLHYNPLQSKKNFADKVISSSGTDPDLNTPAASLSSQILADETFRRVHRYEEALHEYQAARFSEACQMLESLLQESPNDRPAQLLLERSRKYAWGDRLSAEALRKWTGVYVLNEK